MGGVNGSTNSQAIIAGDSIILDFDLDEMADEWASLRNENTYNSHSKSELELYLEESTLPSTNLIFCHGGRIIKANILYLQRLQETFW